MYRAFHQEFLLNCDFRQIELNEYTDQAIPWGVDCITIRLSDLDCKIGNEEHWNSFVSQIPDNAWVILQNDRPESDILIYKEFSMNTIKAYIIRLKSAGIPCVLRYPPRQRCLFEPNDIQVLI